MKTKEKIGGTMFVLGLAAAVTIEGSLAITFSAIATMFAGGMIAKLFDFQKR